MNSPELMIVRVNMLSWTEPPSGLSDVAWVVGGTVVGVASVVEANGPVRICLKFWVQVSNLVGHYVGVFIL